MPEEDVQKLVASACRLKRSLEQLRQLSQLTPGEYRILFLLQRRQTENGMPVGELCTAMKISRSGISHLLAALEQKQLLVRMPSPKDRRVVYVRMTEQGLSRYHRLTAGASACLSRVLERMGHDRTAQLAELLDLFTTCMDAEIPCQINKTEKTEEEKRK